MISRCAYWSCRALTVAIGLSLMALIPGTASEAATLAPELPQLLALRLEDGRHRTPGLTLSFALPGAFDYECQRIVFREDRRDREIRIALVGVAPAVNYSRCRMAKAPAPIRERVALPPEPGIYRIVFLWEGRRDVYALSVDQDTVALDAEGSPSFTTCEQTGKLRRVGVHWLWVEFSFLTDESLRKLNTQRAELLRTLTASGAKPFEPPPGRYLLDGFVRQIPAEPQSDADATEEHFFLFDGDWEDLRRLASRYRKYSRVVSSRPFMRLWLSSRDNVVSTSDGQVYTSILQNRPSSAQRGAMP